MNPNQLECTHLIAACANDRNDEILWSEFLRRYGWKIRRFIAGTCAAQSAAAGLPPGVLAHAIEPSDLLQSVLVRLVENDCALIKRFAGTNEDGWLAYLAVVTRSVVRDLLRSRIRSKRLEAGIHSAVFAESWKRTRLLKLNQHITIEQGVLAGEVKAICERTIRNLDGEHANRDILIFHLYFFHDLSVRQIAACKGVELTASGVKKVLAVLRRRVRKVIDDKVVQISMPGFGHGKIAERERVLMA
jgi:DNA-directed RNA polymerase specialized sigma24 family protein